MTDTIDLLEAIGRDASLRHASAEELAKALEQAQASEALAAAAASGDRARLFEELGHRECEPPQSTQMPGHEEEEEEPDQHEEPRPSPVPGQEKPSPRR
ncbi:hypothetical protein [Fulvimonas soli]|uniref:Uncharacterized protein n=1 Tax=Fulvimonas soli TaxID=155197 RepID=A0A316IH36_9GAMM|nr:hypothetical protein [Fulvimonas soli]PWK92691.1 hypothetical protein C7456_10123 [Fulvimonas soli]TNY25580.1 hypothetical protein BV497_13205 [Fulvimonas soli]